jgi:hypothetical protein
MEIAIDVLENFNKENNTKYTLEEWEKSNFNLSNKNIQML